MRCQRCHAKVDPGRKTCPTCGTVVRKRRGSVTLAPEVGGTKLQAALKKIGTRFDIDIDPKVVLLAIVIILALALFITFAQCNGCMSCKGCSSCDSCTSCASCGSAASCASCGSCASCNSCASCGSCTACGSCTCGGSEETEELSGGKGLLNAPSLSNEYYHKGTLYYIDGNNLVALSDSGVVSIVAAASGMSSVYADDTNVYYLKDGSIWAAPITKPATISDDPDDRYAAKRILNATVSGSDAGVRAIYGYGITNDWICYWGPDRADSFVIGCKPLEGGAARVLNTGSYHMVQCYDGSVYFLGRDEADYGILYRIRLDTGEKTVVFNEKVYYFTLSQGCVYPITWINKTATLYRVNVDNGEVVRQWEIDELSGILANDSHIFYCVNDSRGGNIYRMAPDGTGRQNIFYDSSTIQLTGVCGKYFSLYTDLDMKSDKRYENAVYYVIDSATGEKIISRP